ncbi:helix-turn-helix domain-containing protein [Allokutzneria oryzae]|uniref:Helix-turn-helix domain-containing protein n=1 Tax=Allokutzneria oryzae TaxID=1378989 RepID=A0ABV5ZPU2_9PSEU
MGALVRAWRTDPHHRSVFGPGGITQTRLARWASMPQVSISRLENGPPEKNLDKLVFWARLLGIPGRLLWFDLPENTRPRTTSAPAPNAAPVTAGAVGRIGAGDTASTTTPAQAIRETTRHLIDLDNRYGAHDVAPLAIKAFRQARRTWNTTAPTRSGPDRELCAALGELAEVAGWIAFDAEQHHPARRLNEEALHFSRMAGDRSTELLTLLNFSMQESHLKHLNESLMIATSALENGRLSPRVRAMFHIRQARALSKSGQHHEALRTFERARVLFGDGTAERDPEWAWWIDTTELLSHQGLMHAELGRPDLGIPVLHEAVNGESTGASYRAITLAQLWSVMVAAGAWQDAQALTDTLAERVRGIGHTRATGVLLRTRDELTATPRAPAALTDAVRHLIECTRDDNPL